MPVGFPVKVQVVLISRRMSRHWWIHRRKLTFLGRPFDTRPGLRNDSLDNHISPFCDNFVIDGSHGLLEFY
jgi:hypothetical protein